MTSTLKINSILLVALTLLLTSNTILATTKLTKPVIEQWIQSQSAFVAWGEKNEKQLNSADSLTQSQQIDEHQNPLNMSVSSMIQPLKTSGLYSSASDLVRKFQFSSLEQWADITIRITSAAAAIEIENNPETLDTSKLEALQNSSELPPEQKALIAQAIEQNKTMVKQFIDNTNESDKLAVKPFLTRIHQLMNTPQ